MKKYDSYKNSGIEWIGEIPSHWEVKKIKYLASINDDSLSDKTDEEFELDYVDISSIESGVGITKSEVFKFKDAPSRARRIVKHGDVIISTVRTYLKAIAKIDKPKPNLIVSTGFAVLRPKDISPEYSGYLFYHENLLGEIVSRSVGVSYPAINSSEIGTIKIPLPKKTEQTAIATYLDRKTAEIDALIADKKRLLELYEEEKTTLINQAVTKGIHPDVPMKDSGSDGGDLRWLGEIPAHWEVKRLSWCFEIIGSGTTPKAGSEEYYSNGEFNWLLTGDLTDDEILETSKKVTQKALDDHTSLKKYPVNSIVMAMYGATIGKLGILKIPTTVNQACCVMGKSIHLHYQFAFFLLLAARKEIINMSYGGGQPNISQELIKSFRLQVPPIEEQHLIVRHIETESALIDVKKAKTEKLIDLLTEYRTALISEVVTGKVKVID